MMLCPILPTTLRSECLARDAYKKYFVHHQTFQHFLPPNMFISFYHIYIYIFDWPKEQSTWLIWKANQYFDGDK